MFKEVAVILLTFN